MSSQSANKRAASSFNPEENGIQVAQLEIDTSDVFQGQQVLKRGAVLELTDLLFETSQVRQLLLTGGSLTLFVLKTPGQLIRELNPEQVKQLRVSGHEFFERYGELLSGGDCIISPENEASQKFTIFEEMIESYIFLGGGQLKASMVEGGEAVKSGHGTFQVQAGGQKKFFSAQDAQHWVTLLNQLARCS